MTPRRPPALRPTTCRRVDWSVAPNVLMGLGVMLMALWNKGWDFDLLRVVLFVMTFACGVAISYAFMLVLLLGALIGRERALSELLIKTAA